ncbi:MAG: malate synthase G [Acidimicrobiales bacterium]
MRVGDLDIADPLHELIAGEVTPSSGVEPAAFWAALETIVADMSPANAALLARRDELQAQIDDWHLHHRDAGHDPVAYVGLLRRIGYLADHPGEASIDTTGVDPEIASIAGPQLVVPLDNSRYALNAANARWGSLYDALYGTDVLDEGDGRARGSRYNPIRGDEVIRHARAFLDRHFGLDRGAHAWATGYSVIDGRLVVRNGDGAEGGLLRPERLAAYAGDPVTPSAILLRKHGLGCEIRFDPDHPIGRHDHAGICDIQLESAVTTIMDCEDSVSAVDADDKVVVYRNWLGVMRGDLTASFVKNGETVTRTLAGDRDYTAPDGSPLRVHGRSLMLVRNVGHHLRTDIVTHRGEPIFETILDAMVTALCAKHDLLGNGRFRNSRSGSIYIVKPKMHGPDEVAWADELFSRVEVALGLAPSTLKMGIMDEERRTSLNLAACIGATRSRVVFINTGFLDRTGDEIHTGMEAGPMVPKGEMKQATWLGAYEDANVDVGLACGLAGRAQIGKGMWAMPEEMRAMVSTKIAHPLAGASTAWVPSPTAATLHAMHYFSADVAAAQVRLAERAPVRLEDLVAMPVLDSDRKLTDAEIQRELENNVQGILGYVVRWVGQGVGCSTVRDISDVGLMEDLATLRISSQHVANWLHHGVLAKDQVRHTMMRMANLVDQQNSSDPRYQPMAADFDASVPFQAALQLVLEGRGEPNGYTERILRSRRREMKAAR